MEAYNREIRTWASALEQYSLLTLPNVRSDMKVAALRRRYVDPANRIIEDMREAVLRNNPVPDGATDVPADVKDRRDTEWYAVLSMRQELPKIPARFILTEE